ncbi:hypothetical protein K435DRAFT_859116 [Dendrothele bispora CBS 962.96]|uniref:Uncharacterized protein n=1 Tax=Dendrothele bispora (strain CBS 962.96) TaxID=1314807 RepID=A0A4S8M1X3_DENBC|nr:hypothetical protein K435DRAFT_859116 [Dendrothele bispora CBS 962.96]
MSQEVCIDMRFSSAMPGEHESMRPIYPSGLHTSRLSGKSKDVCGYLAHVQGVRYAVTTVHTKEEYELFHGAVKAGGQCFASLQKPDFMSMVKWWSEQAERGAKNDIFYKLPEHLEHYYTIWDQYRKIRQILIESQTQRQPHHDHVYAPAANYVSHTLAPAKPLHSGTQFQQNDEAILVNDPASCQMGNMNDIDGFTFTQSSSASPILFAQKTVDINISAASGITSFNDRRKRQFSEIFMAEELEPSPLAAGSQTSTCTMQSQVHMNFSDYNMQFYCS